ncbi:DUF4307 domain-containing protein [Streptomyces sp. ODS28]|uniref:DUF4307 domain-containing protein n=1 Tax=Streptomyces sp. ODS28 TaxID=3136688 RepID=UPI0031E707A4
MAADVRPQVPEGRYGRGARAGGSAEDARTDRRLKIVGAVLGAVMTAVIAWIGVSYIAGQDVSGELIKFDVVSAKRVDAHLEIRKDAGAQGVCTLRAQAESGAEVGRKNVDVPKGKTRIDTLVHLRTTAKATSTELVGCTSGK